MTISSSSCPNDVIVQSPRHYQGRRTALVVSWQLPLLALSAEDRLHLLICCAFALFDLPGF